MYFSLIYLILVLILHRLYYKSRNTFISFFLITALPLNTYQKMDFHCSFITYNVLYFAFLTLHLGFKELPNRGHIFKKAILVALRKKKIAK